MPEQNPANPENQAASRNNPENIHWFWRLTTKWWFFPVFYVMVALLLTLQNIAYEGLKDESPAFLFFVFAFSAGIYFFLKLFNLERIALGYVGAYALFFQYIIAD